MARIHAPELEDERWFPQSLRDSQTAFLQVVAEKLRVFASAGPVLRGVLERHGTHQVIDLCSGGGGPIGALLGELDHAHAVLTDLYPNHAQFDQMERRLGGRVRGHRHPVDATDVPVELNGVRTMFNALHHFRPADARRMLLDAALKKKPFCAFEVVERHPYTMATVAGVPFAVLALTPFTRPNLLRLALTYAVPVLPLAVAWDGFASCLRAYSFAELRGLADSVDVDGYAYTVERSPRGLLPIRVSWLIGEPC